MAVSALSKKYEKIADCIQTPVELNNPFTGQNLICEGIWDTGATHSAITKKMAQDLGLAAVQKARVRGVHGAKEVNVYYVGITLNNRSISVTARVTECDELSSDNSVGLLVGMNIITMGDFCITNYQGKTSMSFRVPSVEKVDYVEEIEEYNRYLKLHISWSKEGNEKCPCGSGKKYKNCHGESKYSK